MDPQVTDSPESLLAMICSVPPEGENPPPAPIDEAVKWRALHCLERRFGKRLFRFVLRVGIPPHDAEDVVREVFIRIWECRSKPSFFDPNHVNRTGHWTTARAWLWQIAFNRAMDFLRRNRPMPEADVTVDSDEGEASPVHEKALSREPNPEDMASAREHAPGTRDCIDRLPEELKLILHLVYEEGFTFEEAARSQGIAKGTIASRSDRMRQRLSRCLESKNIPH